MMIGVLALQGDFKEHMASLHAYKVKGIEVRTPEDLKKVDALILPGGESTTISKLLLSTGLDKAIIQRSKGGMPIWGTCAGAILLSKTIISPVSLETSLRLIDVTIERNSYGRQSESFSFPLTLNSQLSTVFFIRAPRITKVGKGVKVLARHDKDAVMVRAKNVLATTFHSEFSHPNVALEYFLSMQDN